METKTQSLFFLGTYVKPQQQTTLPSRAWKRIEEQKTSTKNATSKPIPEEPISNDPFHEALEKLPTFNGERKRVQQRGTTTTTTTTVNCEEQEQQQPCRIPREKNSSNGGEEIETDSEIKSDRWRGRRRPGTGAFQDLKERFQSETSLHDTKSG